MNCTLKDLSIYPMKARPIWPKFVSLQELQFIFGDIIAKGVWKRHFSNTNTIVYFNWGGGKEPIRKFRTIPKMASLTISTTEHH